MSSTLFDTDSAELARLKGKLRQVMKEREVVAADSSAAMCQQSFRERMTPIDDQVAYLRREIKGLKPGAYW